MPSIQIIRNDVSHALAGLNPQKVSGPDGVHPIVLKNCASVFALCLVNFFRLCLLTSFLLEVYLHTTCSKEG